MKLYLVRHAIAEEKASSQKDGDRALTDEGREKMMRAAAGLHAMDVAIEAIATSPLRRARETAARIAEALDAPEPTILHGLRELSWGHHMGQLNQGPTRVDMTRVLTAWQQGDLDARVLGGEIPGAAWGRAMADLTPLAERHVHEDVIVVAHGRINKILMSGLLHGHLHHMERYPQANAGISILEGPIPWRVRTSNTIEHLEGLRTLEERTS